MGRAAFVGVDIGGTKTALAIVTFPEARPLHRIEFPTPPRGGTGQPFLDEVARQARTLADEHHAQAIGISICELVGPNGAVKSAHRVAWKDLPVAGVFIGGPKVVVESDVRAGALAEARYGAGRGFHDLLYVNLGTGISSCWVSGGQPHRGARGNALVLGSSAVETVCEHCGERSSQVLEELAGAAGLVTRYNAAGGNASSARDVFEAAEKGDRQAADVLDRAVHALGAGIGHAIDILDPDALVIGGGLALAGGPYGEALEQAIRKHVWCEETRALPILRASLGADSALIGAAAYASGSVVGGRQ